LKSPGCVFGRRSFVLQILAHHFQVFASHLFTKLFHIPSIKSNTYACVFQLVFRWRQSVVQSSTHHLQVFAGHLFFFYLNYFVFQVTIETRTRKTSGIHKFQVHAMKTSRMRIFTDNAILFKAWLSCTELMVFLICTPSVVFSPAYFKLTFFSQMIISDDAAELPLAMKWASVVVTACYKPWSVCLQSISCESHVKCLYSSRTTCLSYDLQRDW